VADIFNAWKSRIGVESIIRNVEDFTSSSLQEFVQHLVVCKGDFLIATVALKDQSPTGFQERDFAERLVGAMRRGIMANVPTAMDELYHFSEKKKFNERKLKWIKFLLEPMSKGFAVQIVGSFTRKKS
jgi:hypothetical protein